MSNIAIPGGVSITFKSSFVLCTNTNNWYSGPNIQYIKKTPTPLVPITFESLSLKYLYVSSNDPNKSHCPFGPARYFKGKPLWVIDGSWLSNSHIKIAKEILANPPLAPKYINHSIYRYPALWVLENGPVTTYWDGGRYRPSLTRRLYNSTQTLLCLWEKLIR